MPVEVKVIGPRGLKKYAVDEGTGLREFRRLHNLPGVLTDDSSNPLPDSYKFTKAKEVIYQTTGVVGGKYIK